MKKRIAITIGDFNGIGPEIVLKSISHPWVQKNVEPFLIGSSELFSSVAGKIRFKKKFVEVQSTTARIPAGSIPVFNVYSGKEGQIQYGRIAPDAGVCAGISIERAVLLCLSKEVQAMVTAPVSKESLNLAGYRFPGQTEMLAMLSRSEGVTMMLISGKARIALASIHVPLRQVIEHITLPRLTEKLISINRSLMGDFGILRPAIAVLSLNPHAGENGSIGTEEKEIITPAIEEGIRKGINVTGPFPADGFFGTDAQMKFDAVLAMYHDQGLIPVKMMGMEKGVNFSVGLPIVRTSPDHGTAFSIAGKWSADPKSMVEAIRLTCAISTNRNGKN